MLLDDDSLHDESKSGFGKFMKLVVAFQMQR
jgi:hypothetical protein